MGRVVLFSPQALLGVVGVQHRLGSLGHSRRRRRAPGVRARAPPLARAHLHRYALAVSSCWLRNRGTASRRQPLMASLRSVLKQLSGECPKKGWQPTPEGIELATSVRSGGRQCAGPRPPLPPPPPSPPPPALTALLPLAVAAAQRVSAAGEAATGAATGPTLRAPAAGCSSSEASGEETARARLVGAAARRALGARGGAGGAAAPRPPARSAVAAPDGSLDARQRAQVLDYGCGWRRAAIRRHPGVSGVVQAPMAR